MSWRMYVFSNILFLIFTFVAFISCVNFSRPFDDCLCGIVSQRFYYIFNLYPLPKLKNHEWQINRREQAGVLVLLPLKFGTRGQGRPAERFWFPLLLAPACSVVAPSHAHAPLFRLSFRFVLSPAFARRGRPRRTCRNVRRRADTRKVSQLFFTTILWWRTFASRKQAYKCGAFHVVSTSVCEVRRSFLRIIYRFNWTLLFRSIKKRVSRRSRAHRIARGPYMVDSRAWRPSVKVDLC